MGVTSAGRGYGSTFFFELPVYGPDYNPPQPQQQQQPPPLPQPLPPSQPVRQLSRKLSSLLMEPRLRRRIASGGGTDDRSTAYSSVVDPILPTTAGDDALFTAYLKCEL